MAQQTRSRTQRAASTAKRTAAKKAPAKRAPAGKAAVRRPVAKKAPAKKAPAKKAPAKKATVKKVTARKAPAKKAPTTRAAAKATKRPLTARGRVSRNETPNTPDLYESDLGRMRVDELRQMAREHNIAGQSRMRKPELVKALLKSGVKKPTGRAAKKAPAGRTTPARKTTTTARRTTAAKKTTTAAKKTTGPGRKAATSGQGRRGIRAGPSSSRSLQYAQVIESTSDRPDRPGRSLVTTNHDVIRKWAEERNAIPATVEGTKQRDTISVLRFDFPLGPSRSRLRHVSWDEWFKAFDERGLNFIYQEQTTNGRQSNFFRLENPAREDA
jgi:hypothetical protein